MFKQEHLKGANGHKNELRIGHCCSIEQHERNKNCTGIRTLGWGLDVLNKAELHWESVHHSGDPMLYQEQVDILETPQFNLGLGKIHFR